MTKKSALAAALVLAAAVMPTTAWSQSGSERSCYRASFETKPLWISSATWVEEKSSVVVVDPFRNKLLLFSPDGKATFLPDPKLAGDQVFMPASISASEDGFRLRLLGTKFLGLDERLEEKSGAATVAPMNLSQFGPAGRLGSVYQWTMAGNDVFAFGSLAKDDGSFKLGFLRVPTEQPSRVALVKAFSNGDYYALGYPLITNIGSTAYFLLMDDHPAIYRAAAGDKEPARLMAFPREFSGRAPTFTTVMTGPATAGARFAELAKFSIPTGLYSQNGFIYLLARQLEAKGGTIWWLYKIDPRLDKLIGRVRLPTQVPHVTLVPAGDKWILFERGEVGAMQQQKIESFAVVRTSAIEGLSLPASCPDLQ